MRGKDHLHYLIHSLSKSEKRYFTMDARKSGRKQSRYLELFHFINKQTEYDEAALKKKFGKKLADDKSRLYEALLSSLRDYQSSKSYKTRIKELLTDAKILFERKLYEQCENRLSEAKSLALELDDHLSILEINLQQRQLTRELVGADFSKEVELLIKERELHSKLANQEAKIQDIFDQLFLDIQRNEHPSAEIKTRLFEKYSHLLNLSIEGVTGFSAKRRLHQSKAVLFRLIGETLKEYDEFEATLSLWQQVPKIKQEYYHLFLTDGVNLLAAALRDKDKISDFPKLFDKLKSQEVPSLQGRKLLFERTATYQLVYLLNSPTAPFYQTINEIENALSELDINKGTELSISMNIVLLYFLNDEFEKSIIWSKRINTLRRKVTHLREDIFQLNAVIELLSIYCTKNYEETERALRRCHRFFMTYDDSKIKQLANKLIESIRKILAALSRKQENDILKAFMSQVKILGPNLPGGLYDICETWIQSETQGISIRDIRVKKLGNL